ncbi:MAG: 50S ribosomal protein L9 [Syntrophorhabdaceae bacterium]|nr:50S ribosomal protein L9 [Syntrophorhabdaceae bacterium]
MKVILTQDMPGTGKKGETVEVREGYGRNFLIPKGFALPATEGNIKRFEHIVKSIQNKKARAAKTAEATREKLKEVTLVIKKKAGTDGKLFGSVTNKDVAEAIYKVTGYEIDKKDIEIPEQIKSIGTHTVEVHLDANIDVSVKVEVEKLE